MWRQYESEISVIADEYYLLAVLRSSLSYRSVSHIYGARTSTSRGSDRAISDGILVYCFFGPLIVYCQVIIYSLSGSDPARR